MVKIEMMDGSNQIIVQVDGGGTGRQIMLRVIEGLAEQPYPPTLTIRYEAAQSAPWASYRNGALLGRDHSEHAAMLRQASARATAH